MSLSEFKNVRLKFIESSNPELIQIPGCLSYTTRALIIASLTKGLVTLKKPLISDDVWAMIKSLKTLGLEIEVTKSEFKIWDCLQDFDLQKALNTPENLSLKKILKNSLGEADLYFNINLSGRTARSLLPLLCLLPGTKILTASQPFLKRPIGEQVRGLIQLGAKVEFLGEMGKLPLKIHPSKLKPGKVKMRGDISAQFFAGIMMIAPVLGEIELEVEGEQASKAYIDITIDIMQNFGVKVINQDYQNYFISGGQNYYPQEYHIEGDYSAASYLLSLAVLSQRELYLSNLNPNSKQGDKLVLEILKSMGNQIEFIYSEKFNSKLEQILDLDSKPVLKIQGGRLKPFSVNLEKAIDQAPTMAVLGSFISGKSVLKGLTNLKYKETDRLQAVINELSKMGIKTNSDGENLTIYGGLPSIKDLEIETYHDHRIAMAFSLASIKIPNLVIKDPKVVEKSWPEFWEILKKLGLECSFF